MIMRSLRFWLMSFWVWGVSAISQLFRVYLNRCVIHLRVFGSGIDTRTTACFFCWFLVTLYDGRKYEGKGNVESAMFK